MTAGRQRFNIYLLLALALAIAGGCRTAERKRRQQASTLRLHLEARPDGTVRNEVVQVFRGQPMSIGVEKVPFLTEGNVKEASVVDAVGGFALRIQFDHQGALLLEQYSTLNRGKRVAVFSQFGEKLSTNRWLAAPLISRRITDGQFLFTPDATREEADQIALGLNNVARKVQDKPPSW
ncbi:MAG: hypothetical protein DME25_14670 [Verrucomicrobia bacterium]|nr:MAG: hypothetical protein DME25_14670 [Verrucomicrobiota bacterium]